MDLSKLLQEVTYKAVKSSGSGGQNVNKVATKVQLNFNIEESNFFNNQHKEKLSDYLKNRLTNNGVLILTCGETRSQLKNKSIVTKRFLGLIEEGLKEEKERRTTQIPKAIKQKRLDNKKKNSQKKANRKSPKLD